MELLFKAYYLITKKDFNIFMHTKKYNCVNDTYRNMRIIRKLSSKSNIIDLELLRENKSIFDDKMILYIENLLEEHIDYDYLVVTKYIDEMNSILAIRESVRVELIKYTSLSDDVIKNIMKYSLMEFIIRNDVIKYMDHCVEYTFVSLMKSGHIPNMFTYIDNLDEPL